MLFILTLFITACTTPVVLTDMDKRPDIPLLDNSYFGGSQNIISVSEIYQLSEQNKKEFLAVFNSNKYKHTLPNKRIYYYLKDILSELNYYSKTLTANEVITHKWGNCLSLAIATKALADIAGVEIRYELVSTPAIFQREGDVILVSQHLRTVLLDPREDIDSGFQPLWRGSIRVDYYPDGDSKLLRRVSETEFFSMYYQNKAAEALTKQDFKQAFWLLKSSLDLNRYDSNTINMLAIIHGQMGYEDMKEEIFKYGMKYGKEDFGLLSNYHKLLISAGRDEEAKKLAVQLMKFRNPDPYKWIRLGDEEFQTGNFSKAIYYYKKATKEADYIHESYAGISDSYYSMGKLVSARNAMKKALKKAKKPETVILYQMKFDTLSELVAQQN